MRNQITVTRALPALLALMGVAVSLILAGAGTAGLAIGLVVAGTAGILLLAMVLRDVANGPREDRPIPGLRPRGPDPRSR